MSYDQVNGIALLVMQIADDGGEVLNVVVEGSHGPVTRAVAVATEVEAIRVDGERLSERAVITLVLVCKQPVQDESDASRLSVVTVRLAV